MTATMPSLGPSGLLSACWAALAAAEVGSECCWLLLLLALALLALRSSSSAAALFCQSGMGDTACRGWLDTGLRVHMAVPSVWAGSLHRCAAE